MRLTMASIKIGDEFITADEFRGMMDYDCETGEFHLAKTIHRVGRKGRPVKGGLSKIGYIYIGVKGKHMLAHRMAWLHHYGEWPNGMIDHINGVRSDNRIANLRVVDYVVNGQNRRAAQANSKSSSLLGVSKQKDRDKFRARIFADGREVYLGCYETEDEAHAVYIKAKRILHAGCVI